MRPLTRAALARLPKAELHLHLEGALTLGDLRHLYARARRPPVPRPRWASLYRFRGFDGFLRAFGAVCALLETPADFGAAALRVARRLRGQGVRRAEILVSLPVHLRRGLSGAAILESLWESAGRASGLGLSLGFILDGVRQWGPESLAPCVELARRFAGRGVLGIGVGGEERARPPEEYADLYRRARAAGLRTVVHAGETGGPDEIARTLRALEPERLGHALRAAEDPRLLAHLAERRIPVEVAITSNWRTGLLRRRADHPLPEFLRRGVNAVLATDDPAFFGTTLTREYRLARRLCGLDAGGIRRLASASLRAAFTSRSPRGGPGRSRPAGAPPGRAGRPTAEARADRAPVSQRRS